MSCMHNYLETMTSDYAKPPYGMESKSLCSVLSVEVRWNVAEIRLFEPTC